MAQNIMRHGLDIDRSDKFAARQPGMSTSTAIERDRRAWTRAILY